MKYVGENSTIVIDVTGKNLIRFVWLIQMHRFAPHKPSFIWQTNFKYWFAAHRHIDLLKE